MTTDPGFPATNQLVTVTFDAALGNGELAGYTGEVYAHTGVITENSNNPGDWKYVKSDWGQNTPSTKLTRISGDIYTLQITPDIRNYYSVPENENILQMAFVFRSGEEVGGSYLVGRGDEGEDIFVDVSEPGLNVTFLQPDITPVLIELNETFVIEVASNEATQLSLYVDNKSSLNQIVIIY